MNDLHRLILAASLATATGVSASDLREVWRVNGAFAVPTVHALAFSPRGDRLVSGGWAATVDREVHPPLLPVEGGVPTSIGQIQLWNAETGALVRNFEGNTRGVTALAWTPGGSRVVSGAGYHHENVAILWDAETGREIRVFEGHSGWVSGVAVSPDGTVLLTASQDQTLRTWSLETGQPLRTFTEAENRGANWTPPPWTPWETDWHCVALSPTGRLALSGGSDLVLWDVASAEPIRLLRRSRGGWVLAVAFSPKGMLAASGGQDKVVRLWDIRTGEQIRALEGHTGYVMDLAFSPDGDRLLSGGLDHTLRLWDVRTGNEIAHAETKSNVYAVAYSPGGRHVASGHHDGTTVFWEAVP
jgi:WD40 repeat protein